MIGLSRKLSNLLANIAMGVLALMMLHVSASIGLRLFTGRDIPLTLELTAAYYMVALTFLPLAAIDLVSKHIQAEFLSSLLPQSFQKPLTIITRIAMFGLLALLTYQTTLGAIARTKRKDSLITILGEMPSWPARWIVPVGLGFAALVALVLLYRSIVMPYPASSAPAGSDGLTPTPQDEDRRKD